MIDLSLLDRAKTNALIIRHSDRDHMDIGQTEQPLNEAGQKHAKELGENLRGFSKYVFFSSPVDRCQQTVEHMQKGIFHNRTKVSNTLSTLLGKPGCFVVDRKNNAFRKMSCSSVVKKQIAHEELEGIRSTVEGTKLLIDFVIEQMKLSPEGSLLVFVTHDAIVAPVIFELTGEKFDYKIKWPDFLDGFIIKKQLEDTSGEYIVIRNGNFFDLRRF